MRRERKKNLAIISIIEFTMFLFAGGIAMICHKEQPFNVMAFMIAQNYFFICISGWFKIWR